MLPLNIEMSRSKRRLINGLFGPIMLLRLFRSTALAGLPVVLILSACTSSDDIAANQYEVENELPDREGWNAVLTETKNGIMASRIKYGHMAHFAAAKTIEFDEGVEIEYYDEEGNPLSTVAARAAVLEEESKNIVFNGDVRFASSDGIKLFSEELNWHDADGKVYSDAFVTVITAEDDTINGTGFESEKSLARWSIKKPWGTTQKKLKIDEAD